ncbi:beta-mannosidase [Ulvibacter antarcticus]|uniref:beta-mannosidase n=1 Tax=Ulvibacter antarcticus TaxID=442714 RepID=A0A3L9Z6S7_9FLAO|nr:beta-mannosidase [Ulvibacter antarcticus]
MLLLLTSCYESSNNTLLLNDNWQFSELNSNDWQKATVPGTVQTDLLSFGKIPDSFKLNNEDSIQWISEKNWQYKKVFTISEALQKKTKHFLKFEGLDTYASVFLNDSLILTANNAFRSWEADVSDILSEENELKIIFKSTDSIEKIQADKLDYTLPEGLRVFTRKPQFQYGWDWGPTIKTMGIWRDISLISYDNIRLKDVFLKTESINVLDSLATLTAFLDLDTPQHDINTIEIVNNTTGERLNQSVEVYGSKDEYAVPFQIKNPKLWWTHNLGEPFLYDITVYVKHGNSIIDSISKKVGLRTIKLVAEKDSIGESFYFKLNGIPVYMKGANYIPQNIFLADVTKHQRETLLDQAVDANMNMLRIWGGGVYEDDAFYDLCDKKGILLWQDFMYACAMYPGDDDFLENAKQEAIDNVKRLRQHPSIALWCGNNENSEGWHRWGWKDGKTETQKQEIWNGYYALFNHILPKVVDSLNPSIDYWETSPKYGRGNKRFEFEGDAHDWWVWHDGYPFEHFEEQVPRFMSEFGFQSFPSIEAIQYFTEQENIDLDHPAFETHQKHKRGFQLIREYMERDFPVPENDEDYVYVSQLLQAYGITKGIRAHRLAKPYNMGSLYWQLNDCWPVVSWSGIDGLGREKALHYKVKKAFENLLIIPKVENNILKIAVVDDNLTSMAADMFVIIRDFSGRNLFESGTAVVHSFYDKNEIVFEVFLKDLNFDRNASYAEIHFGDLKEVYFFGKPKDLKLPIQDISMDVVKTSYGFLISLTSETLQKDVFLFSESRGDFSDNFFDLLPGEAKEIELYTEASEVVVKMKTLNKILNP